MIWFLVIILGTSAVHHLPFRSQSECEAAISSIQAAQKSNNPYKVPVTITCVRGGVV